MLYFICINIKNTYLLVLTYTVYTEYFDKKLANERYENHFTSTLCIIIHRYR